MDAVSLRRPDARRPVRLGLAGWTGLILFATLTAVRGAPIGATVVDRDGARYTVTHLKYQQQPELEVYVGDTRQLIRFRQIDRLSFGGGARDTEVPVSVYLRDGRQFQGRVYPGSTGGSPHRSVVSGTTVRGGFSGRSDLGPFFLLLEDVKEIRFTHLDTAAAAVSLQATIVDTEGKRYEVRDLRFRNRVTFDYQQGRNRRSKPLAQIARIDFDVTGSGAEQRPVTITFRSGKTAQGTVDASTVRVPGENDRLYDQRVYQAVTGRTAGGPFAIGLHQLRLIRFDVADSLGDGG